MFSPSQKSVKKELHFSNKKEQLPQKWESYEKVIYINANIITLNYYYKILHLLIKKSKCLQKKS